MRIKPKGITFAIVKLIGISGMSGSGKTYLVKTIQNILGHEQVSTLSFDDYYKPVSEQIIDPNGRVNFDHPHGVNHLNLLKDLYQLKSGSPLQIRQYDFNNPFANPKILTIEPKPLLLIEGIFVFHFQEIKKLLDFKIYIETDPQLSFERRMIRDNTERGIAHADIKYQWENHVIPSYINYLEPYKQEADILLRNDGKFALEDMEQIHKKILSLTQ